MRKKSHILLARYLADQMSDAPGLQAHRKAFCLGSILPDVRPSFLTKKHEFDDTFGEIQEKIDMLVNMEPDGYSERVFWRRVGEVLHYIADYFTFPHNRVYTGTLLEHSKYEKKLKKDLKTCIQNGTAYKYMGPAICFETSLQLGEYVRKAHAVYLQKMRDISDDISFILSVCFQVAQGMFRLSEQKIEVFLVSAAE